MIKEQNEHLLQQHAHEQSMILLGKTYNSEPEYQEILTKIQALHANKYLSAHDQRLLAEHSVALTQERRAYEIVREIAQIQK